ncbi:tRNA(Ile)-lysidine synthase [Legionella antarctica]|uniref:tRNA(Ile)-lysidine synthase n=1 Tax=Legionella antarctica TaxID=2708020 RepID=A0A6F8T3E7_9GAMM|nr:tRNA lysidine(34) synthetase TilS [Legionella antarctica]BCA94991.1 tRNA(Ile)-lysidine synthase [Legionella antarctica]
MTKSLLNAEWIARLREFNKLIIGFSGGLDSTVLLHVLATHSLLRHKLIAVHINHGISSNAEYWQNHCEQFCLNSGIDFLARSVQFDRSANVEEQARIARYTVFSSLLEAQRDCLVLAHHQDDQAETVLLQLFRGAGVDGLAAMSELSALGLGALARPLLIYSREQLEHYAASHQLKWIEDESNLEINYSRNYLRHQIMPLLLKKWPGVAGNIARTSIHCQQAKANLDDLAIGDNKELLVPRNSLFIEPLKKLSTERLTNVLRVWLKKNQIQLPSTATFQRLIHELICAGLDATPIVSWGEIQVRRYQQHLYLDKKKELSLPNCIEWTEFPLPLALTEYNFYVTAKKTKQGLIVPPKAKVVLRFREGGEHFCWHGQTKQLKKLFQEWAIPPWLRAKIPLLFINDELAAVVGYAVSDLFFSSNSSKAWLLVTNS